MGGGDLNLKKSWHPSTLRNQEKVWKAEQKNDMEKKKIAELQREIIQERAREDMQKHAEDSGAIEKKDSMKLDWMYKGPGAMVNKEEYLLGRCVDKTFELAQQAEKATTSSLAARKNHVDHECLPPSIFAGGTEQVDMVRKLQEDPLYAIKKKESETRSQILKNPVKLKQLRELIAEEKSKKQKKHKKDKKKKKSKKSKRNNSASDSDELDALLMAKYKKLKDKLQEVDMAKLGKDDSSEGSASGDDNNKERKSEKHSKKKKKKKHHKKEIESSEEEKVEKRKRHHDFESDDESKPKKSYGLIKSIHHSNRPVAERSGPPKEREHKHSGADSRLSGSSKSNRWVKPERKKLTEEEMEQRRMEMMDNVKWRDQERVRNVSRYRKEEKEESKESKNYSKDFLTKQLSHAASQGTVAGRIKSNVNNIQRSGMAMDKNFARR